MAASLTRGDVRLCRFPASDKQRPLRRQSAQRRNHLSSSPGSPCEQPELDAFGRSLRRLTLCPGLRLASFRSAIHLDSERIDRTHGELNIQLRIDIIQHPCLGGFATLRENHLRAH
jgi:hypothetical protein